MPLQCSALAFAPHQHGLILAAACSRQHTPAGASSRVTGSGYVQLWEADRKASRCSQWTLVSKIEVMPMASFVCLPCAACCAVLQGASRCAHSSETWTEHAVTASATMLMMSFALFRLLCAGVRSWQRQQAAVNACAGTSPPLVCHLYCWGAMTRAAASGGITALQ
jgi:lysylphosphatidylglycerol synthetase-like protein (DUF2156 family)